jgi:hypothetical protein
MLRIKNKFSQSKAVPLNQGGFFVVHTLLKSENRLSYFCSRMQYRSFRTRIHTIIAAPHFYPELRSNHFITIENFQFASLNGLLNYYCTPNPEMHAS